MKNQYTNQVADLLKGHQDLLEQQYIRRSQYDCFKFFKSPFTPKNYPGKIVFHNGRRLKILHTPIHLSPHEQIKYCICMIVYDADLQTAYMIQKSLTNQVPNIQQFKKSGSNLIEYFKKWRGYRIVHKKSVSYGIFQYFYRQGFFTQISLQVINQQIPANQYLVQNGCSHYIQQFQGSIIHDFRQNKVNRNEQKINGLNKVCISTISMQFYGLNNGLYYFKDYVLKGQGNYKSGRKHGSFTFDLYYQKELIKTLKQEYINGHIQSQAIVGPYSRSQRFDFPSLISISLTEKTLQSLEQKKWLRPDIIDYFFRRLSMHHMSKYQTNKTFNMRAMPVSFSQSLMPSGQFMSNLTPIYYESISKIFDPHQSYFFQVNQLILMPLNRDKNHFALGAIWTQISRCQITNKINKVQIRVYDLDSINSDMKVSRKLIQLLKKAFCLQQACQKIKHAIFETVEKVNTTESLKATMQDNHYDCGLYVCIYGLLLYQYVCRQKLQRKKLIQKQNQHACNVYPLKWNFDRSKIKQLRQLLKISLLMNCIDLISQTKKLFID